MSKGFKLTGLSALNVRAINEVLDDGLVTTTATTAEFHCSPREALSEVQSSMYLLPGRGHPKASLHAVVRRITGLL